LLPKSLPKPSCGVAFSFSVNVSLYEKVVELRIENPNVDGSLQYKDVVVVELDL